MSTFSGGQQRTNLVGLFRSHLTLRTVPKLAAAALARNPPSPFLNAVLILDWRTARLVRHGCKTYVDACSPEAPTAVATPAQALFPLASGPNPWRLGQRGLAGTLNRSHNPPNGAKTSGSRPGTQPAVAYGQESFWSQWLFLDRRTAWLVRHGCKTYVDACSPNAPIAVAIPAQAPFPLVSGPNPWRVGRRGLAGTLRPSLPYIVCTRDLMQYWLVNRCYIRWFLGVLTHTSSASHLEPPLVTPSLLPLFSTFAQISWHSSVEPHRRF